MEGSAEEDFAEERDLAGSTALCNRDVGATRSPVGVGQRRLLDQQVPTALSRHSLHRRHGGDEGDVVVVSGGLFRARPVVTTVVCRTLQHSIGMTGVFPEQSGLEEGGIVGSSPPVPASDVSAGGVVIGSDEQRRRKLSVVFDGPTSSGDAHRAEIGLALHASG